MAFVEIQFPTDISYGSAGGPEYATDIVISQSGAEQRNVSWSQARAVYNVAYGVQTPDQLSALIAFFRARKGRAYGFRFKDWTDYQATAQWIGTGDGTTTQFQLQKIYESGGVAEYRTISKPVSGTVNIYLGGTLQTSGYALDTTTGIVTFATAPAASVFVTADFEFDVPVRFDTDKLSATIDSYGVNSWQNVALIEVRV